MRAGTGDQAKAKGDFDRVRLHRWAEPHSGLVADVPFFEVPHLAVSSSFQHVIDPEHVCRGRDIDRYEPSRGSFVIRACSLKPAEPFLQVRRRQDITEKDPVGRACPLDHVHTRAFDLNDVIERQFIGEERGVP